MFTIAKLTIMEAIRKKVVIAAIALGLLFLIVFGVGFHFIRQDIYNSMAGEPVSLITLNTIYNFLSTAGLYAVNFLVIAISLLVSAGTIAGEISSGSIQTLVTKPISRNSVFLGKWVGYLVMMFFYLLIMGGGVIGVVFLLSGYIVPNAIMGLLYLSLNAFIFLNISFLGGTFLSPIGNGVLGFGLFGVAFVGGWIEQIGAFLENQVAISIGILTSLLFPSEAIWKIAVHNIQSKLITSLGFSPFSSGITPSKWMIVYIGLYLFATLFIGMSRFRKMDL